MEKVLRKFKMDQSKAVNTPMGIHFKLPAATESQLEADGEFMRSVPYCNVVGRLICGMIETRPDLTCPVEIISRFISNPIKEHWNIVKWVLRYVNGSTSLRLKFKKGSFFKIYGFCDADYAADLDRKRSLSGYTFL